jgi:hypothetical protein
MNIETRTPPRALEVTGSVPWAAIPTLSRDPSPFWPGGPKSTPEKGIEAIPTVGLGENPGTLLVSTPEYNYNLTSPPLPKDSSPATSSPLPTSPQESNPGQGGCTKYCFDVAYTLHHHDHSATEPMWTMATMIEERPCKHPIVWGYGFEHKQEPTWERLDQWDGWEEEELDNLRAVLSETLKNLTSAIQCRHWN